MLLSPFAQTPIPNSMDRKKKFHPTRCSSTSLGFGLAVAQCDNAFNFSQEVEMELYRGEYLAT
jgi:hypothetical protein